MCCITVWQSNQISRPVSTQVNEPSRSTFFQLLLNNIILKGTQKIPFEEISNVDFSCF